MSQAAELKSLPPIASSPTGVMSSSRAAAVCFPVLNTLSMRRGRWIPKARFTFLFPAGTSKSTGRIHVPSSRWTLERAEFARSMARVERKFSSRTVSAAVGLKWCERRVAHKSREARKRSCCTDGSSRKLAR
eukprot:1757894-Pleurochrysis_carterae.AAC.2